MPHQNDSEISSSLEALHREQAVQASAKTHQVPASHNADFMSRHMFLVNAIFPNG
jgi:hypothetical protein